MRKISLILVLVAANAMIPSAMAESYSDSYSESRQASETQRTGTTNVHLADSSSSAASSAAKPSKYSGLSGFPMKALGFTLGTVVGLPISVVRNPIAEQKWSINNWTQDNSNKPRVTIPAGIVWAPFSLCDGILLAPFSTLKHAAQSWNDPFSKEQFSLGDITR